MATSLKRVMAERKKILNAHPNMSNAEALKKAWAKARGGRVSGVKKKAAKKKTARKRVSGVKRRPARKKVGKVTVKRSTTKIISGMGAIKATARAQKDELDEKLSKQYVQHLNATTKKAKRAIAKRMSETRKQISSVKRIINKK